MRTFLWLCLLSSTALGEAYSRNLHVPSIVTRASFRYGGGTGASMTITLECKNTSPSLAQRVHLIIDDATMDVGIKITNRTHAIGTGWIHEGSDVYSAKDLRPGSAVSKDIAMTLAGNTRGSVTYTQSYIFRPAAPVYQVPINPASVFFTSTAAPCSSPPAHNNCIDSTSVVSRVAVQVAVEQARGAIACSLLHSIQKYGAVGEFLWPGENTFFLNGGRPF